MDWADPRLCPSLFPCVGWALSCLPGLPVACRLVSLLLLLSSYGPPLVLVLGGPRSGVGTRVLLRPCLARFSLVQSGLDCVWLGLASPGRFEGLLGSSLFSRPPASFLAGCLMPLCLPLRCLRPLGCLSLGPALSLASARLPPLSECSLAGLLPVLGLVLSAPQLSLCGCVAVSVVGSCSAPCVRPPLLVRLRCAVLLAEKPGQSRPGRLPFLCCISRPQLV